MILIITCLRLARYNMDVAERELIASHLHQIDLMLRKIDRKAMGMLEAASHMQGIIKEIEKLKEPIYQLLDEEYKPTGNKRPFPV